MDRDYWIKELEEAEDGLGFSDGYQFVYGPWDTLEKADIAFLSLNPGKPSPYHMNSIREISNERGNTYEEERHTTISRINEQFLQLARLLGRNPAEILTGVVVPFRSAKWDVLKPNQKLGSLAVGRRFWKAPLSRPDLRLVIVCSREAKRLVVDLTAATPDSEARAGWGNIRLRRYRSRLGKVIVQLPHLSRFTLLGREPSESKVRKFLDAARALAFGSVSERRSRHFPDGSS